MGAGGAVGNGKRKEKVNHVSLIEEARMVYADPNSGVVDFSTLSQKVRLPADTNAPIFWLVRAHTCVLPCRLVAVLAARDIHFLPPHHHPAPRSSWQAPQPPSGHS